MSIAMQIIPPVDKGIAKSIEDNLAVWTDSWNTEIVHSNNDLCVDPYKEVYESYYNDLRLCSQHRWEAYSMSYLVAMYSVDGTKVTYCISMWYTQ